MKDTTMLFKGLSGITMQDLYPFLKYIRYDVEGL